MTENTITPVATLKAEIVNEIEFIEKEDRGSRYNDHKTITHPFDSNFSAKVAVKVGNVVKELTLFEKDDYISGYRGENGMYVDSTSVKGFAFKNGAAEAFADLENAGIAIDYSDVWEQYAKLVEWGRHRKVVIERAENWVRIRARKAKYINSWIHNFVPTLKADKNKKIQAALLNSTFEKASYNSVVVNGNTADLNINYKGYTGTIYVESGSYMFDGTRVRHIPEDATPEQIKDRWSFKTEIAEGKVRRAKREGTLYLKFTEEVDYEIAQAESIKKHREKQVSEVEQKRLILEKATGYPVYMNETREYSRDRRSNHSWLVQKYYLITAQPKDHYSSFKGIQVSCSTGYDNPELSFSVNGCNNLREEQFKGIVDILVDGREIFAEVVKPKKPENY